MNMGISGILQTALDQLMVNMLLSCHQQTVALYYYNYKGFHSLILMAHVNAKYEFIMCDFGINGCVSDGGG